MQFEKLEPGMVLWEVRRSKMGNTNLSTQGMYRIDIVSVDKEARTFTARWNSNPARTYTAGSPSLRKWRKNKPMMVQTGLWGQMRLATREELKAAKESK